MIIGMIKAHPIEHRMPRQASLRDLTCGVFVRHAGRMTVRDLLTALQTLPRDAELLAFEAGSEDYCEREVDDHLGPSEMAAPRPAALHHAWWSGHGCQPLFQAQRHGLLANRCRHRGQRVEQRPIDRASNRPIDDHGGKSASWTLGAPATPLRHAVMWLRASSWTFTAPRPSSRASSVKDSALPAR
jgi:hypothetical protein